MKKDNRGFLLAESLVVSTFVLTVLILLYIQFSNLTTNYKNSYNYNNVESLYDLSSVANYLQANNYNLSTQLTSSKPYVIVYKNGSCNMDAGIIDSFCDNLINKMDAKTIIYTYSDISVIKKYISTKEDNNINQKLRDFIMKVETNVVQNKGRLFAEFDNGTYATIAMDNQIYYVEETPPEVNSILVGGKEIEIAETGDGLYKDTSETDRYFYKGKNPNNYITFNNETWRIVSINQGGSLQIIKNESIGNMAWDSIKTRSWDNPASLNTYLNSEYINEISVNADKIISHNWPAGIAEFNNNDLYAQINSEKSVTFDGKIGLITASEYIRTNNNLNQCGSFSLINNNATTCLQTNWLNDLGNYWWTISNANNSFSPIYVYNGGLAYDYDNVGSSRNVFPSLYLTADITLTGDGTKDNPYKIG